MTIRIFAASVPTKPLNDAQTRVFCIYTLLSKYAIGKKYARKQHSNSPKQGIPARFCEALFDANTMRKQVQLRNARPQA